ncbi:MAG: hypothetical protein JXR10_10295 [Cyclobacteriaceae bacterium]
MRNLFKWNKLSSNRVYAEAVIFSASFLVLIILTSELVFDSNEISSSFIVRLSLFILILLMLAINYAYLLVLDWIGAKAHTIKLLKIYLIYGFVVGAISVFINLDFLGSYKPFVFATYHIVAFLVELFFLIKILDHIFRSDETQPDHIWGATLSYFMIILLFSECYEIITIFNPTFLGQEYVMGLPNYTHCVMFSLNTMSGIDSLYPEAHDLLKRIASFQSVVGNLFLIIVLGRLLSHPLKS